MHSGVLTKEEFEVQGFEEEIGYDKLEAQLYDFLVAKMSGKARAIIRTACEGSPPPASPT